MIRIRQHLALLACNSGCASLALRAKRSRPLILLYHGVSDGTPPIGLPRRESKHIHIDVFVRHLKSLKRLRCIIPLHEMVEEIRCGGDLRNTVSITFDDGYENNFRCAAPALSDFGMSAAFFLATGYIGRTTCIWTDQLETTIKRTTVSSLKMRLLKDELPLVSIDDRERALRHVKAILKTVPLSECLTIVAELAAQLRVVETQAEGDSKFMNWTQARLMADAGFEIGGHSVHHPILSRINIEEAISEIAASRDTVLAEIGKCSTTFAYPNGQKEDYSREVMEYCRRDFRAALSTERGPARASELYELRRISPVSGHMESNVEWTLLREK